LLGQCDDDTAFCLPPRYLQAAALTISLKLSMPLSVIGTTGLLFYFILFYFVARNCWPFITASAEIRKTRVFLALCTLAWM
jgi:hypothetical protein